MPGSGHPSYGPEVDTSYEARVPLMLPNEKCFGDARRDAARSSVPIESERVKSRSLVGAQIPMENVSSHFSPR